MMPTKKFFCLLSGLLSLLYFTTSAEIPCLHEVGDKCSCNWEKVTIKCCSLEIELDVVLIKFVPVNVKRLILNRSWSVYPTVLKASHMEILQDLQVLDLSFNFVKSIEPRAFK